ncbi:MAG: hypothetical protein LBD77_11575 [Bifidobacteriaceae bacterium]|jgi:beta-mannosidase|nr:hypothetical protein [Bifidobacteriaceae bacterium]
MNLTEAISDFTVTWTADRAGPPGPNNAHPWLPAQVPGEVHADLIAAGIIGHPYQGCNEEAAAWVADQTWWYRASLPSSGEVDAAERIRLVFAGIDTVADIYLDGQLVAHHENMFRPCVVDLTDRVRQGRAPRELLVAITPPLDGLIAPPSAVAVARQAAAAIAGIAAEGKEPAEADETVADAAGTLTNDLALTWRRKPTLSWGWDFAPALASIGLWQPVSWRRERLAVIERHLVALADYDPTARQGNLLVRVDAEVFAETAGELHAEVTLTAPNGTESTISMEVPTELGHHRVETLVPIAEPALWWTHDLGTPSLYRAVVKLQAGSECLEAVRDAIGLRTIAVDQSADTEGGHRFGFVLNGVQVFARGANWVPPTMMMGTTTPERYRALAELAVDANMNMLRIWGGGAYEDDSFYRACDELGVLVWQDFMFASAAYPGDSAEFLGEVTAEARHQVARLANRASVAMWAGENEVQAVVWLATGLVAPNAVAGLDWGRDIFHRILPAAVAEFAPTLPYRPGCPWGEGDPTGLNGVYEGDRHAWEVWHGGDIGAHSPEAYANQGEAMHFWRYRWDQGRFISEFGLHASPAAATWRHWVPGGELGLHTPAFDARIKDRPVNKADDLLEVETGLPADFDDYVVYTQAVQAEGLKFGVEHYRHRWPHCSGTLVWQFNDPWPGTSWSVVDWDLQPKAAYHALRRAYAPVIASFHIDQTSGELELWATSAATYPVDTVLDVAITRFGGQVEASAAVNVQLAPLGCALVWRGPTGLRGRGDVVATLRDRSGIIEPNRSFFTHLKDISFPAARLTAQVSSAEPGKVRLVVDCDAYAFFVHLTADDPQVRFSANYFDLAAGERRLVEATGMSGAGATFTLRDYRRSNPVTINYQGVHNG